MKTIGNTLYFSEENESVGALCIHSGDSRISEVYIHGVEDIELDSRTCAGGESGSVTVLIKKPNGREIKLVLFTTRGVKDEKVA